MTIVHCVVKLSWTSLQILASKHYDFQPCSCSAFSLTTLLTHWLTFLSCFCPSTSIAPASTAPPQQMSLARSWTSSQSSMENDPSLSDKSRAPVEMNANTWTDEALARTLLSSGTMLLGLPGTIASALDVNVLSRGRDADNKVSTVACSSAGRIGRFCSASAFVAAPGVAGRVTEWENLVSNCSGEVTT